PLNENGNVSDELSDEFTLEMVQQACVAPPPKRSKSTSASGSRRARTTVAAPDTIEVDKYNYFKANRDTLPDGIQQYSTQISELMRAGHSAEAAFTAIINEHFA